MSRRQRRPARRFAVRTLWVLVAIGLGVHWLAVQAIDAELGRQLAFHAEFVTESVLAPSLDDGAVPDDVLRRLIDEDPQITGISVESAGWDNRTAPAPGRVVHEVAIPGAPELVAVVTQDTSVVDAAATELTRRVTLVLGAGLVLLWALIVPLAYRLGRELRAQTDELRAQADELRVQGEELLVKSQELQRLLDREHLTVLRLKEVDELRDRFLESISHELRTPLTVVKGSLQMLATKGDMIPEQMRAQMIERANDKAARLDALLQALLDLNASAETLEDVRWCDLTAVVADARRSLPPRDVELDLAVDGIVTDRVQLVRAIGALLGNCIRHAPGEEPVVVRAQVDGDDVELQVDDSGPGVAEDLRLAVFDPFRQGPLQDAHSPGTGIGLSLVAAYASQHNGRAWITESPTGGARVHVLLCGVVGERPPDEDLRDASPASDASSSRAIVTPVVDDERLQRPVAARAAPEQTPAPDADTRSPVATTGTSPTAPVTRRVVRRTVRRNGPTP